MKLSIITINYNNREGLKKTIDSVVCQTWRDFEWIVIDGGSTDGSRELIEQYQDHFAYWCSEPDKGIYNAMNKGIAKAKGEFFLFLNSGDALYSQNTLSEVFSLDLYADIIVGQVIRADNQRLLRKMDENVVKQLMLNTLNHQAAFINRKLFDNYSYREDYKIVSDWIAWMDWLINWNHSYQEINVLVAIQDMTGIGNSEKSVVERKNAMKMLMGERLGIELPALYKELAHLKGDLNIPAIKGLRYLLRSAPFLFSILYRVIMSVVVVFDFFSRKTSYADFEK